MDQTSNFDKKTYYRVRKINVLNSGYIKLIDAFGSDALIASAARVSRDNQDKATSEEEDAHLIDNLIEWGHTTPFEFASMIFEVKCPIFVARQWFRHRTFTYMERSGRYGTTPLDYYLPESVQISPDTEPFEEHLAVAYNSLAGNSYSGSFKAPNEELRTILPEGTYTTFWCKADLHNLLHFLKLRLNKSAQKEIRAYAKHMYEMVKALFPLTARAFDNHVLNAVTLSGFTVQAIQEFLECELPRESNPPQAEDVMSYVDTSGIPDSVESWKKEKVVNNFIKFITGE